MLKPLLQLLLAVSHSLHCMKTLNAVYSCGFFGNFFVVGAKINKIFDNTVSGISVT